MQLLISDANILIDLEAGLLIEKLFQLPYEFAIPDILFFEELDEHHEQLPSLGLNLAELSSESMVQVQNLVERYSKTSRNDCFALALAKQESCPLLTGDRALRDAAEKEAVIVMGTIWLLEQMICHQLISIKEARTACQRMKGSARRLPWSVIEEKFLALENGLG